jgi:hypothetical protein
MSDQEEKKTLTRAEINRRYIARKIAENPNYVQEQSARRKANRLKKKLREEKQRLDEEDYSDDNLDDIEMEAKGLDKSQKRKIKKLAQEIKTELIKSLNSKDEIEIPTIVRLIKGRVKKNQIELDNTTTKNSLIDAILKANSDMKRDTIRQYVSDVGNIYAKMFNKTFKYNNFDWLKNDEKVVDFINDYYENISSRRTNISRIYNLLPFLAGLDYLIDRYKGYKKSIDDQYDIEREEGKLTEAEKKLWLPWTTIKQKVNDNLVEDTRHSLLTKLYTEIPPRRTRAYSLLKVIKSGLTESKLKSNEAIPESWVKSEQEINNDRGLKYSDYNYAIFKQNKLVKIILNQYKTSGKYGTYVIKIPQSIQKASKDYISESKLVTGSPLFPNNKSDHYTNQGFSGYIKSVFEKYTDKKIGSNILRHSFITDWSVKNPNPTLREQTEIAKQLGHKKEQFQQYKRFVENDPILRKKIVYNLPKVSQLKKKKKSKKSKK